MSYVQFLLNIYCIVILPKTVFSCSFWRLKTLVLRRKIVQNILIFVNSFFPKNSAIDFTKSFRFQWTNFGVKCLILAYFTRCSGLIFVEEKTRYIYPLERELNCFVNSKLCENRIISDVRDFLAVPCKYSNFFRQKFWLLLYLNQFDNLSLCRSVPSSSG